MEIMISKDGVTLCAESFGRPSDPALLLIMGSSSSMIWWEVPFCEKMAARGFFVIRFDIRDTGKTTTCPPGSPNYSFEDMADDAVRVLDHFGIDKAVVMGMSLGSMLSQLAALRHPERVSGLVLHAGFYSGPGAEELPMYSPEVEAFFATYGQYQPTDDADAVRYALTQWQTTNKSSRPKDAAHIEEMIWLDLRRANNYQSRVNHALVQPSTDGMEKIYLNPHKTLVIHGTEDAVIPYVHALKQRETLRDATLLTLEGAGHELHPQDYNAVADGICASFLPESPK